MRRQTDRSATSRPQTEELGRSASKALLWSFGNTALSRLGTLAIGVFLARQLGPTEYGTFAVATVALLAVLSFNELGISLAIVRWPGDPRVIAPTVMTISSLSSVALFAATYFCAPHFASAMGDPASTDVVRVMAICIVLNGVVAAPAALMQREFRQRERMAIDQVNIWLGAAISVVLVLAGMGAMSLAIGRLVATVVSGLLFLAYSPHGARFGFERSLIPPLLRFGLPLAAASVLVFAAGYSDQLIVGSTLGATQLGFYVLAFNLSSWPVSLLSQPLRSVAPALFARVRHDSETMTSTVRSTIGLIAAVAAPMCMIIAGAAGPIVEFVYGSAWSPAARVLTFLAVLALLRILFELMYDYLVVVGWSARILGVQFGWLIVLVPAAIAGSTVAGIEGVALAQLVVAAMVPFPLYLFLVHSTGLPVLQVLERLSLPVAGGVATLAASLALSAFVPIEGIACLAAGVVGAGIAAMLLFLDRHQLSELRDLRSA